MPSDSTEPPKRNKYDQWVFETLGVDPGTYPPLNPPPPPASAAAPVPAAAPAAPDADLPARKALAGKLVAGGNKAAPEDVAVVAGHLADTMP